MKTLTILLILSGALTGWAQEQLDTVPVNWLKKQHNDQMWFRGKPYTGVVRKGQKGGRYEYGYTEYDQGLPHGTSFLYHPNGQMRMAGHYQRGTKAGMWRYYSDEGILVQEGGFDEGSKSGEYKHWREDGTPYYNNHYKHGVAHGTTTEWDASGRIIRESHYTFGEKVGTWKRWNGATGSYELTTYPSEEEVLVEMPEEIDLVKLREIAGLYYYRQVGYTGLARKYHANGQVHVEMEIREGKPIVRKGWYNDGTAHMEGRFLNGKEHGHWEYFHPENGELMLVRSYKQGLKEGEWLQYNKDGSLHMRESYKKDEHHGTVTVWQNNGHKNWEAEYVNGKREGRAARWHANGQLYREYGEKDGEWHGRFKEYNDRGKLISDLHYDSGKIVGKSMRIDPYDGELRTEGSYVNGLPHGRFISWFANGRKASQGDYLNGEKHGEWITWFAEDDGYYLVEEFDEGDQISKQLVSAKPNSSIFTENCDDLEFGIFLDDFRSALGRRDSVAILNFIADDLGWGKYNCREFSEDGNGCTKWGVLSNYWSGPDGLENFCSMMLSQLLDYGVGMVSDPERWPHNGKSGERIYSNYHFVDKAMEKHFFDYNLIVVEPNTIIYTEPSSRAKIVGPAEQIYLRGLEVGEVVCRENGEMWQPVDGGYVDASKALTGFDWLMIQFALRDGRWKLTGIYQPPGC